MMLSVSFKSDIAITGKIKEEGNITDLQHLLSDFILLRRNVIPVSIFPGILLMSLMPATLISIPLISISTLVKRVTGKSGQ